MNNTISLWNAVPFLRLLYTWGGGGYSQKNWIGVCGRLPKTLTLFMTKIYNFPFPIYDLIVCGKLQFKSPGAQRVTGAHDKPLRHVHSCCQHHDEEATSSKKKKRIQD